MPHRKLDLTSVDHLSMLVDREWMVECNKHSKEQCWDQVGKEVKLGNVLQGTARPCFTVSCEGGHDDHMLHMVKEGVVDHVPCCQLLIEVLQAEVIGPVTKASTGSPMLQSMIGR